MNTRGPHLPSFATRQVEIPPPQMKAPGSSTPAIPDGVGYEMDSRSFAFPMDMTNQEQPVWSTTRRWKAIDVYVAPQCVIATFHGELSIFVYAETAGIRSLVASGRIDLANQGNFGRPVSLPAWVCGGRSETTNYLVTYSFTDALQVLLVPQQGAFNVTCVASDRADPVPAGIGEFVAPTVGGSFGTLGALASFPGKSELVALGGANTVAAARWLHVHDRIAPVVPAGLAGLTPRITFPMGAVIGDGFYTRDIRFRARGALMVVCSSTALTTTAAADGAISVSFR